MDVSIAKEEPVDSNETAMSPESPPPEEQDSEFESPAPTPTPKKRFRKKNAATDPGDQGCESPTKKTKTKSPKKPVGLGPIPTSYEEASDEDKLLIRMKEVDNKPWAEIKKALEEITGTELGAGLHVRYSRMKANFVVFEKGDEQVLMQSKKEIEDKFEVEKWQKIADSIETKTGNKYPSSAVQKMYKELNRKSNGNGAAVKDEE
ncbi:hypothetical protein SI65_10055 [Aspergillus cristatus]|uniref:Myb-like domain-containing protein n=1 Tax=Aspergillus cristatus TaxID=573508 RepID=A0A1E3B0X7_ASPCR|nr:hypothetical protein SI65_10055 [Aspergillus cristatus]